MASSTVSDSGSALAVPVGMPRRYGLSGPPEIETDDGGDPDEPGDLGDAVAGGVPAGDDGAV
jgi:hypothetical protein